MSPHPGIRYRINARDEIISVNEPWREFAAANDCGMLVDEQVLGRSLWEFIFDPTTRQLYQQILKRVRQGLPAKLTLRCDGPSHRRLLEMTITAVDAESSDDAGVVEFATQILHEEQREPMLLLSRSVPRSADLLRSCAWCGRLDGGSGLWEEVEHVTARLRLFERDELPQLTHGICQTCLAKVMDSLETPTS